VHPWYPCSSFAFDLLFGPHTRVRRFVMDNELKLAKSAASASKT
jgi:hypothetical protein